MKVLYQVVVDYQRKWVWLVDTDGTVIDLISISYHSMTAGIENPETYCVRVVYMHHAADFGLWGQYHVTNDNHYSQAS
jgi:hypothetical protein